MELWGDNFMELNKIYNEDCYEGIKKIADKSIDLVYIDIPYLIESGGSTGKAVMLENKQYNKDYKYIGIELTDEYLPIAKARIEYICNNEFTFEEKNNKVEHKLVKENKKEIEQVSEIENIDLW